MKQYAVGSLELGNGFDPCWLVEDKENKGYYTSDITNINDKRIALFKDLESARIFCHSELEFVVSLENPKKVLYRGKIKRWS